MVAPEASPSRPSVRFTALAVPATMMTTQMTKGTVAIAGPKSRRNERWASAGVRSKPSGCRSTSNANTMAMMICPASFARLRNPTLVCRKTFM